MAKPSDWDVGKHLENTGEGLGKSWTGVTDFWNIPKHLQNAGDSVVNGVSDAAGPVTDYLNDPLSETKDITAGVDYSGSAATRDINSVYSNAYYQMLTGKNPQLNNALQQRATEQANRAFSPFGQAMDVYAKQQSDQQRRAVEQRLSGSGILGTGSGAATSAISQAIAKPYAEANVAMQQQYGNLYQNAYQKQIDELSGMSQAALVAPQTMSQLTGKGEAVDLLTKFLPLLF